jgi:hypothetical protein
MCWMWAVALAALAYVAHVDIAILDFPEEVAY